MKRTGRKTVMIAIYLRKSWGRTCWFCFLPEQMLESKKLLR